MAEKAPKTTLAQKFLLQMTKTGSNPELFLDAIQSFHDGKRELWDNIIDTITSQALGMRRLLTGSEEARKTIAKTLAIGKESMKAIKEKSHRADELKKSFKDVVTTIIQQSASELEKLLQQIKKELPDIRG